MFWQITLEPKGKAIYLRTINKKDINALFFS